MSQGSRGIRDIADVLIVAAHPPELVGMRTLLGPNLRGDVRGLRVRCRTVGVGLAIAGAGMTRGLVECTPRAVILTGSYGIYPTGPGAELLDMLIPDRVTLIDPAVLVGKAAFPAPMQTEVLSHRVLTEGLRAAAPTALGGSLGTTLSVTTDDALASRIGRKSKCVGENLEAFAVALTCASHDLPFALAMCATNNVGGSGRGEWSRLHRKAATTAGDVICSWLDAGAPGVARQLIGNA